MSRNGKRGADMRPDCVGSKQLRTCLLSSTFVISRAARTGPRFYADLELRRPPLFGHPRIVSLLRADSGWSGTAAALPAPKPRAGPCSALACIAIRIFPMGKPVFIVQGKPRGPAGILKVVRKRERKPSRPRKVYWTVGWLSSPLLRTVTFIRRKNLLSPYWTHRTNATLDSRDSRPAVQRAM